MQNYKNHRQVVISYHGLTWLALIVLLAGSIRNVIQSNSENLYAASLILLLVLVLVSVCIHSRRFGLIAQDRAIRAEESLRHFILTGKPIDSRLTLTQIIALRFASDEELPALSKRAIEEGLSSNAIKQSIKTWKPDTHRV